MKTATKLMTVTMLSSLVLLGACGKNQESAKASFTNSKDKTVQTSKTSASKAKKATKSSSSTSASDASKAKNTKATSNSSATTTSSSAQAKTDTKTKQASQAKQSGVDLTALTNGDFSSIKGTWSDDKGQTFAIAADGSFSSTFSYTALQFVGAGDNYYSATAYNPNQLTGSSVFIVTPAGKANIHTGAVNDKDTITIGQSEEADYHPFYRTTTEVIPQTTPDTSVKVSHVANGDFSSVAGTWSTWDGVSLTIGADGSFAYNGNTDSDIALSPEYTTADGAVYAVEYRKSGQPIASPMGLFIYKDKIYITGQSVGSEQTFYRQ